MHLHLGYKQVSRVFHLLFSSSAILSPWSWFWSSCWYRGLWNKRNKLKIKKQMLVEIDLNMFCSFCNSKTIFKHPEIKIFFFSWQSPLNFIKFSHSKLVHPQYHIEKIYTVNKKFEVKSESHRLCLFFQFLLFYRR